MCTQGNNRERVSNEEEIVKTLEKGLMKKYTLENKLHHAALYTHSVMSQKLLSVVKDPIVLCALQQQNKQIFPVTFSL